MKILVAGDTHADWSSLNILINKKNPDIILQCGDFGYWPNEKGYELDKIKNGKCKIYWCDGNHERHDLIKQLVSNEVHPNIFYQPRGSYITLMGKNILFIGGADSIDKQYRTPGYDWFPDELITQKDVYNLPDVYIDIVISHTAPWEFDVDKKSGRYDKTFDPSRDALHAVLWKYKPDRWFFGHWHYFAQGAYKNTRWWCLNMISQGGDKGNGRGWMEISL